MSVEYLCFLFWVCNVCVIVVFQGSDGRCVLSARLEELVEMFSVVSDIVCEVCGNMFAFCFPDVFCKCLLEGLISSPVLWCVVSLRASVESLFLAVLSA